MTIEDRSKIKEIYELLWLFPKDKCDDKISK